MSANRTVRRSSAALGAVSILALSLAGPASARQDPGTGEPSRCTAGCFAGPEPTRVVPFDDNAVEYVQLGGGMLVGIALAGTGMALVSRHNHRSTFRAA